jgi:hypothetical protein
MRNQKILLALLAVMICSCGIKKTDRAVLESDSVKSKEGGVDTINYLDKYSELLLHAGSDYIKQCSPDTVYPGDTVTLKLNVPHGADIVITRPDSISIFLDLIQSSLPHNQEMKKKYEFALQSTFDMPVPYQTDPGFAQGKKFVFEPEGVYKIVVLDVAESDFSIKDECEVIYLHRR